KMVLINTLLEGINVREIMTREVKTVLPTDTVGQVLKVMFQHRHMGYPVYKDGNLMGIVTFHDLSPVLDDEKDLPVEEFMTREVLITAPEEDVATVLEKLNINNVGRLPVLENGELVGIISKTDIMKAMEIRKSSVSS
ncbi:MAG TPA: CBS domain-containing protein, partial [Methanobacterium sp.]